MLTIEIETQKLIWLYFRIADCSQTLADSLDHLHTPAQPTKIIACQLGGDKKKQKTEDLRLTGVRQTWFHSQLSCLLREVTLGNLLHFSGPQFPHLLKRSHDSIILIGFLSIINDIITGKHLTWFLTKHSTWCFYYNGKNKPALTYFIIISNFHVDFLISPICNSF